jgi:hypothetical protein
MLIVNILFFIALVAAAFVIKNLLKKVEMYEDDIQLKDEFLTKFKTMVGTSSEKMYELDQKGVFESDDEIGFIFQDIKNISMGLNAYFQNYMKEEDTNKKK